jgi:mannose-6-phosphate isomerase-like protein (cupin superfamily)
MADWSAMLRADGSSSVLPVRAGPPPSGEGLSVGLAELDRAPPHGGECHPHGDEMIVLLSGDVSIVLEEEVTRTVRLQPNEAFIVPRATWHRLLIHRPSRLIHLTPGPSQWRPPGNPASPS